MNQIEVKRKRQQLSIVNKPKIYDLARKENQVKKFY